MSDLINRETVKKLIPHSIDDCLVFNGVCYLKSNDVITGIENTPTIEAVPLEPLCMWLSGYTAPPKYALDETCKDIVSKSIGGTATDRANAWAYHFKNLMERGVMGEV